METVGFQVEGKYFWVYQQTPITADLNSDLNNVLIKMTSLKDIWSRQISYINMDKGGETRSARLQAGDCRQNLQ